MTKIERLCKWLEKVDADALPWGPFLGVDAAHLLAQSIRANLAAAEELVAHGARRTPDCTDRQCPYPVCQVNRTLKETHRLARWVLG